MAQERGEKISSEEVQSDGESQMSSEAAAAAVAAANQQEKFEDLSSETDSLLDDINDVLEELEVVLNYKQEGGQ